MLWVKISDLYLVILLGGVLLALIWGMELTMLTCCS